ncbi:MAG: UDP-N-acetylglucosamine 2-epimerase [Candidatus Heimdallarchaeota archaeon LC_2]|nr:MAG: UDP-N-acetylglucosamine 2-epimerase [Candidatus Heimdallarchaeota archaeon LC_2]
MSKKKILFITGTRADFGKLKPLLNAIEDHPNFVNRIFVTGMHTLSRYGFTELEVRKEGYKYIHSFLNQIYGEPMDIILANTIIGLSRYVNEHQPDLIVVHGDRIETLAGAIVGSLRNILVAHIEGGERSGTIDELIRHSVSKLSHIHFTSNQETANRLIQLGENDEHVFVIGSPEIDVMTSSDLPTFSQVQERYEIPFEKFAIIIFHSVTSEVNELEKYTSELVQALIESNHKFIGIQPNNDEGSEIIYQNFKKLDENKNFKFYPSLRFEHYLTLLKNAEFIIGNSSSGIREAPVYGKYSINVGTRQNKRFDHHSILNIGYNKDDIVNAIKSIPQLPELKPFKKFGEGNSAEKFVSTLEDDFLWKIPTQKEFIDLADYLISLRSSSSE